MKCLRRTTYYQTALRSLSGFVCKRASGRRKPSVARSHGPDDRLAMPRSGKCNGHSRASRAARRPRGRVLGVDIDSVQLGGARAFVADKKLAIVEIVEADAYASPFPDGSFDLTHVRFPF